MRRFLTITRSGWREAVELLGTWRLRFPPTSAPRLLAIKLGQVPYSEVVDEVEAVLAEVEEAQRLLAGM